MDRWEFEEMGCWMDGGSITIRFTDKKGEKHTIDFIQHVIPTYYPELADLIPGRLYFDGNLIKKRSKEESSIILRLQEDILLTLNNEGRKLLAKKITFVSSPIYLNFRTEALELSEKRRKALGPE